MNIEKTLLLFDWDDVLFNATAFVAEFTDELEKLDMSRAVIYETYQAAKQLEGGYSPAGQASLLGASYPEQLPKIHAVFERAMSRVPGFMFTDAKNFVIAAGLKGSALGVLSAGNEQFQSEKIKRSGLDQQFNHIIVVPADKPGANKADEIAKLLLQYERVVFFEDAIDNLNDAAKVFGNDERLTLVYVNRDGHVHQLPSGTVQVASLDSAVLRSLCFGE